MINKSKNSYYLKESNPDIKDCFFLLLERLCEKTLRAAVPLLFEEGLGVVTAFTRRMFCGAKQSPHIHADYDPSTSLGVTYDGLHKTFGGVNNRKFLTLYFHQTKIGTHAEI
jgi:hypothetical protein